MNIFSKLITYDKDGKCENPVALEEKQQRVKLANRVKIEERRIGEVLNNLFKKREKDGKD